mmetsp:Transcript_876/g.900  ORF Transcript_876/g.900 Transcript_876/m.900 type:complete len:94 (+) Transcript_876:3-284(+)
MRLRGRERERVVVSLQLAEVLPLHPKDGPHKPPDELYTAQQKNHMLLDEYLSGGDIDDPSRPHDAVAENSPVVEVRREEKSVAQEGRRGVGVT